MRASILCAIALVLSACGSSTDTVPTRYNFAVIDGANQASVAGATQFARPITSQLARDPAGKFAMLDFLLPTVAYAQTITVAGTPVAGALVCAGQSQPGEPQAVPLCAFTLADGKAPISIKGGTKAGTFTVNFTAQVPSQLPVMDSTTVTVAAGPMATHKFVPGSGFSCWTVFPDINVQDQFGNAVPYRFVTKGALAHVVSDTLGSQSARTFVADAQSAVMNSAFVGQPVTVETASGVIASGTLIVPNLSAACVDLQF